VYPIREEPSAAQIHRSGRPLEQKRFLPKDMTQVMKGFETPGYFKGLGVSIQDAIDDGHECASSPLLAGAEERLSLTALSKFEYQIEERVGV